MMDDDVTMVSKKEIRKNALACRDLLDAEKRKRAEVLMTERILGHQWYYKASEVLFYASYGSEMDTSELIKEAHRQHKKVYLPKVTGDEMAFYLIAQEEVLTKGYKGIPEPDLSTPHERFVYTPEKEEQVLMIMPGAAFDVTRNRIGYGKGFYDRYLADKPTLHTIAIGFDCQMVSVIKSDGTDIKPMQVICL